MFNIKKFGKFQKNLIKTQKIWNFIKFLQKIRGIMPKEIKKLFDFMNLDYNASVEKVKMRQEVMIKVLHAKGEKKRKNLSDKIEKVNTATETILSYISSHDNSNEPLPFYKINKYDLASLFFTFVVALMLFLVTFIALI